MIETKTLITFYHEEKIAKKKILNKDNSIIVNNKKQILENLNFEYSFFTCILKIYLLRKTYQKLNYSLQNMRLKMKTWKETRQL